MKFCVLVVCVFGVIGLQAQREALSSIPAIGSVITDFIPAGYDTIMTASGYLIKDKAPSRVLVLAHELEKIEDNNLDPDSIPPRLLVILFRQGNGLRVAAKSSSAIMCKQCGGIMGDPFQLVEVKKNVLIISHYGGSAWRWGYEHKFRYQGNKFYLIGQTRHSYWNVEHCDELGDFAGTEYEDINLVTGKFARKRISQECKLLENKKGTMPRKPLTALDDFSLED